MCSLASWGALGCRLSCPKKGAVTQLLIYTNKAPSTHNPPPIFPQIMLLFCTSDISSPFFRCHFSSPFNLRSLRPFPSPVHRKEQRDGEGPREAKGTHSGGQETEVSNCITGKGCWHSSSILS